MLEDPSLCSLEKTFLFTSVVDFFQGGFRVRDADWRHLTCDTAREWSEGEVASAPRNCGEAHSSWTGGMEFEVLVTRNFGPLFGMPSSVTSNCPFKYSNTQL